VSMAQEERLKMLGLWPVWRLRQTDDAAAVCEPEPSTPVPPSGRPLPDASDMDWETLRQAVTSCTRCPLHASRSQAVFGVGDVQADWLFIGEAPGAEEDRLGEPFVGQAGKLLDAMLASIGLQRGRNVYIANVLKSRPPGNRDPNPEETAACIPYLERQIELIKPKIIVVLGRIAAQSLLLTETSISRLRGQVHEYRGVPMVVTYHPAYLLRNPADKSKAWEDLCLAKAVIRPENN
jgi:uracil-DNA glycosylase family 4